MSDHLAGAHSMGYEEWIMTQVYRYSTIQNSFTALKIPLCSTSSSLPHLLATTDLFTVSIVSMFPECHTVGVIKYTGFSDWHLSLRNTHSGILNVFTWLDSAFLFSTEYYSTA